MPARSIPLLLSSSVGWTCHDAAVKSTPLRSFLTRRMHKGSMVRTIWKGTWCTKPAMIQNRSDRLAHSCFVQGPSQNPASTHGRCSRKSKKAKQVSNKRHLLLGPSMLGGSRAQHPPTTAFPNGPSMDEVMMSLSRCDQDRESLGC